MRVRELTDTAFQYAKDVSAILLPGLASAVVFVLLLAVVGASWQAALGTGIFIGFVSLLAVMCLPCTGLASTACSATALAVYAVAGSIAGFHAPLWMALATAFAGFALLPAVAALAITLESRSN